MDHGLPSAIDGWFAVASSHEVPRGAIHAVAYMGRSLVLFRTASGRIAAVDAHCPHLGGSFVTMGRVEGEQLVCGAHGFHFDCVGTCTEAYGRRAPNVRLETWHVRELLGAIFVWYHRRDAAPSWQLPSFDETGWSELRGRSLQIATHPQEVVENAVDIGHFEGVHGLTETAPGTIAIDGHKLTTSGTFTSRALGPFERLRVTVHFKFEAYGLGLACSEAYFPSLALRLRAFAAATPRMDGTSDVRSFTQVYDAPAAAARVPLLGRAIPDQLAHFALGRLWSTVFARDLAKDIVYWSSKRYLARPSLARLDPYIGPYRKWAQQFYPPVGKQRARSLPIFAARVEGPGPREGAPLAAERA